MLANRALDHLRSEVESWKLEMDTAQRRVVYARRKLRAAQAAFDKALEHKP